jgi:hypothetical protein
MGIPDSERQIWINRPASEMYLGFAEWIDMKRGVGKPAESAAVISNAPLQFTQEAVGRVRHASGVMNGLEKRYAAHLELRKKIGEVWEYRFEPMKLRLAPRTFLDIDFLVWTHHWAEDPNLGTVELHEVKGHWEDDARVKVKVAATLFPWWTFKGVTWNKAMKEWKFEEFPA